MSSHEKKGASASIDYKTELTRICEKARIAAAGLAAMSAAGKNKVLGMMADSIENAEKEIISANAKDTEAGKAAGLSAAMLDRLKLDTKRIRAMADGIREITRLEDPVGKILSATVRPNGLKIEKVSVPLGVICIVYESRPNVTSDAASLCVKAGNAVVLRGGSEAIHSNIAIAHAMSRAALSAGLPDGAVQLIPWTDRAAVNTLLKMDNYIDVIIPRGGEGLIRAVVENSTIPVIKHYKGVCHLFVDDRCDFEMAKKIIVNAKCQRPGVCNAIEKLLIHRDAAQKFAPEIAKILQEKGVELRGDTEFTKLVPSAKPASEEDWYEEYLDLIITVGIVDSVEKAVEHINQYGSRHSDGILTSSKENADYFLKRVDSATVYHNASTRFTDGGEFGMGAEIGISTDKLHARGPMGLQELTTYKYLIFGDGQIRG